MTFNEFQWNICESMVADSYLNIYIIAESSSWINLQKKLDICLEPLKEETFN